MKRKGFRKNDKEFSGIGGMWICLYGGENRGLAIPNAIQVAANSGDAIASDEAKSNLITLKGVLAKDILGVRSVARVADNGESLNLLTTFPEFYTKTKIKGKITDLIEYPDGEENGFEGSVEIEVVSDVKQDHEHILRFFDTRFLQNYSKYKIGDVCEFHVFALIGDIFHRSPENLNMTVNIVDEEVKQRYREALDGADLPNNLSTADMFSLNPVDDEQPEFMIGHFRFNGFNDLSFNLSLEKSGLFKKKDISHITSFDIVCKYIGDSDDERVYQLPALVSDKIIQESYEKDAENPSRSKNFSKGDPVDIVCLLMGYLAE